MQIAKMLMNTYNQHNRLMRINELINQQPVANTQEMRFAISEQKGSATNWKS